MCRRSHMATNIELDSGLMERALSLAEKKTKKAVVNEALAEYVRHREQLKVLEVFGTVEMDPDYDYKAQRKSR